MEIKNKTTTCADKDKQTLSAYNIEGKEKTLSTSEMKDEAHDGYVRIYECGKESALQSSNERANHRKRPPVR